MLTKFWDLKCCFKKLEAMGNYAPLTELASAVLYARGSEDLPSARGFLDAGSCLRLLPQWSQVLLCWRS